MAQRVARRVPKGFEHPRDGDGCFIPLFDGLKYQYHLRDWEDQNAKWEEGLVGEVIVDCSKHYLLWDFNWVTKPSDVPEEMSYEEWSGESKPDSRDYTSVREDQDPNYWMLYEECTEGTPLSPSFRSIDELAEWLAANNVSVFADLCCNDKEKWLKIIDDPTLSIPTLVLREDSGGDRG